MSSKWTMKNLKSKKAREFVFPLVQALQPGRTTYVESIINLSILSFLLRMSL
uniref:Uncharacterized protein n=1 Tax=Ciona savignyi TaxID=51511 RepID=H2Y9V3_CIOSA